MIAALCAFRLLVASCGVIIATALVLVCVKRIAFGDEGGLLGIFVLFAVLLPALKFWVREARRNFDHFKGESA